MLYIKCACGCGRWFAVKNNVHKYYDITHKKRAQYAKKTGKGPPKNKLKHPEDMTPKERWMAMKLSQVEAEGYRYEMSYGELQQAYYTDTLPEDFGLEILKGERHEETF